MIQAEMKASFTQRLLRWNRFNNKREMPWKGEKDPYKIWLSEVILQQTRVEQGWDYYDRFIKTYPTVIKLANAPDEKAFKLWEGLGYYSRCKNLIATARFIARENGGKFPDDYADILALKGIGPYTAAAISSFAFNLPYAVLDGNVFRVLARFFGIAKDISSTDGKKFFSLLAEDLLDKKKPGIYNQAIMDFGAIVCKPQNPLCTACPLKKDCRAFAGKSVDRLPVKTKQLVKKKRWFYYLVVEHNGKVYVQRRAEKDVWENLYQFVLLQADKKHSARELLSMPFCRKMLSGNKADLISESKHYTQQLSHQTISGSFIHISTKKPVKLSGYKAVPFAQLAQLPFPRFITRYLSESGYRAFER